jgi:hypothetical protein
MNWKQSGDWSRLTAAVFVLLWIALVIQIAWTILHLSPPPRGVARRSNTPGIFPPRALRDGRLGALGASP